MGYWPDTLVEVQISSLRQTTFGHFELLLRLEIVVSATDRVFPTPLHPSPSENVEHDEELLD